jgi:1-pyrroline-5-carboxylate dehydrogenase
MLNGRPNIPIPVNEPIKPYVPGSPERKSLQEELKRQLRKEVEIPVVIGGKHIRTGNLCDCRCPHEHKHVLGRYHNAGKKEVELAVKAAADAWHDWARMPWEQRASIFLRAADMLAGPWRDRVNAATMLGQSKNVFQAEIDSACELIDFWRFNPWYAQRVYEEQPPVSPRGMWNYTEQRALEGFVFAVTPFNFTSIAGNLPTAPAMMGNTVIWKPASSAVFSAYQLMLLLEEAGLPPGVINMVSGSGAVIGDPVMSNPSLAGIHFTGSTAVFQRMWATVGANIANYKTYPRIVGETGGKDFIFIHKSANVDAAAVAMLRGAFEYQGQKCSAASRVYMPSSLWDKVRKELCAQLDTVKMGDVTDFSNFVNAVIDKSAYKDITGYVDHAKKSKDAKIVYGGKYNDSVGYFVEPTVIEALKPDYLTMREEIFGPVLTVYVYEDRDYEKTLQLCNATSPYGLTGAVLAQDRRAVNLAYDALWQSSGNFYINDKPTGAVVGQQPFGGSRASGTNDKAGSMLNLLRWVSQRAVKETFVSPTDYRYPFLSKD